jgi:hypothetical protein
MSEFLTGDEKAGAVETQSMSFEDMVNELAVAEGEEKKALVARLEPSIRSFMHRVLKPYRDARAVMLLEGAMVPSTAVEPDIEATEVMDGVISFKNCAVVSGNRLDLRESRRLNTEISNYFQKNGYYVSDSMGLPFNFQVPVHEFENVIHERAAVTAAVEGTRKQVYA